MVPSPTVCEVVSPFSDVSLSDDECEVIVSYGSLSDDECEVTIPFPMIPSPTMSEVIPC